MAERLTCGNDERQVSYSALLSADSEDRLEIDGNVIYQGELTAAETDMVSGSQT